MSTVTDPTSSSSSNGAPHDVGILDLLTARDFIGVRAELIRFMGNDANRAIVLTRIHFRAAEINRDAIQRDGGWWWRASYETIASETGLSAPQVRRAIVWLAESGYLAMEKHHVGGASDQTLSYRIIDMSESSDDVALPSDHHVTPASDLPSLKEEKKYSARKKETATSLPADWAPSEAHKALAAERGINVEYEASLFRLHAETHDRKAVRWNAAFSMWLTKATPRPAGTPGAAPAPKRVIKPFHDPYLKMEAEEFFAATGSIPRKPGE